MKILLKHLFVCPWRYSCLLLILYFFVSFPTWSDGFNEEEAVEPVSISTAYEGAPKICEVHGSVRGTGGEG